MSPGEAGAPAAWKEGGLDVESPAPGTRDPGTGRVPGSGDEIMALQDILAASPWVITEGAVIERLRREFSVPLDPRVHHAGFVYSPEGRRVLENIYRQYLAIGARVSAPMIVFTPTWRANPERLAEAGLDGRDVNGDGARFLQGIRASLGAYAGSVFIGGLAGCRGDAYRPEEALDEREAVRFHAPQLRALSEGGVDFLMAATMPALSEALGMARAMARTGTPYVISFVIRPSGTLLDGTPLDEAIGEIDGWVRPRPLGFLVNCVHPTVLLRALEVLSRRSSWPADRLLGLQANTSSLSPEELDGRGTLDSDEPGTFARAMVELHDRFGLRVLGGCCGSDHRHIARVADLLKAGG